MLAILVALCIGLKPDIDKRISFSKRIETDIIIPLLDEIKSRPELYESRWSHSNINDVLFEQRYKSEDELERPLDKCILRKYFDTNKDYIIYHLDVESLDLSYNKEEREFFDYIESKKIINSFLIRKICRVQNNSFIRSEPSSRDPNSIDKKQNLIGIVEKPVIGYRYFYTISPKTWGKIKERYNKKIKINEPKFKLSIIDFLFLESIKECYIIRSMI